MDYGEIDRFMKSTGLANDPAFDYLHFVDEPITATKDGRKILGLYYPEKAHDLWGYIPPSTIHLPPDGSEETLKHELGHRYGHYYYNDLSEEYAERWRKAHEGGGDIMRLVASDRCQGCPEMEQGRSRVCMFCELGGAPKMRSVAFSPVAVQPGANSAITDSWVEIRPGGTGAWTRVTEVPVGSPFRIRVNFIAENISGGTAWSASVTAKETILGVLKNWGYAASIFAGQTIVGPITLDGYGETQIMPDSNLNFRLWLWGNDDATPAAPPEENFW